MGRTNLRTAILLSILLSLALTSGSAMARSRRRKAPEESPVEKRNTLEAFDGYFLRFYITEIRTDELRSGRGKWGADKLCHLSIVQICYPAAADTLRFDSILSTDISNLCVFFDGPGHTFCPTVDKISKFKGYYWTGSEMQGPSYILPPEGLPPKTKRIRVNFVASFTKHKSGEELDYKIFTIVFKKEKGNWVVSEHRFER